MGRLLEGASAVAVLADRNLAVGGFTTRGRSVRLSGSSARAFGLRHPVASRQSCSDGWPRDCPIVRDRASTQVQVSGRPSFGHLARFRRQHETPCLAMQFSMPGDLPRVVDGCRSAQHPAAVAANEVIQVSHDTTVPDERMRGPIRNRALSHDLPAVVDGVRGRLVSAKCANVAGLPVLQTQPRA
jgi:hypothetical protein